MIKLKNIELNSKDLLAEIDKLKIDLEFLSPLYIHEKPFVVRGVVRPRKMVTVFFLTLGTLIICSIILIFNSTISIISEKNKYVTSNKNGI